MKTLLLMRHAKSSWANDGQVDWERPLNERGQRDAPRMGQWLRQQCLAPDVVISSTARRAVDTAAAVIDASGYGGEWLREGSLYAAEAEAFFEVLRGVPETCGTVLVIAHNPGIEEVIEALTGEAETMPTAALAQISLPIENWQALLPDVEGKLEQVARPRELG
jgi:phosphohistidine phosphatase